MSKVPHDLKYVTTHEWVRLDESDLVTVGITDHAQDLLGDIVYVELPSIGIHVNSGDECGVVESVKAASDVYSPLEGQVVEVNELLEETPSLINEDPYGEGWIFRIKLVKPKELDKLLDADSYQQQIGSELH